MTYRKIKTMLERALEDVANKGEVTSSNLDIIYKLTSSMDHLCEIEEAEKSNHENNSFDSRPSRNYDYGYDYGMDGGRSNAQRRNAMGRYSREDEKNEVIAKMHELKNQVSDPETKHKIEEMIEQLRG